MLLLLAVPFLLCAAAGQDLHQSHCPGRCLCFRTTVRCMFLQLERFPQGIPREATILDLRFNKIRDIPPNTFKDLPNLNTLLLNNNQISKLQANVFTGLKELRNLYLYKNRIRIIDSKAFQGLDKLEQLHVQGNKLESIQSESLSNLSSLDTLFLHNNKLSRIPYGAFKNLKNLKRLRLDSNALICDCNLLWLAHMLQEQQHTTTQAAVTCEYPGPLQGKPITDLKDDEFRCKKPVLTEEPNDVDVTFGGTVYFACRAEGDPKPDIIWLRDSNEISQDDEEASRYSVLNDGTLMIENAQSSDQGVYECMAKNPVGEAKSRRVKMHLAPQLGAEANALENDVIPTLHTPRIRDPQPVITVQPHLTSVPYDQIAKVGERVSLGCEATPSVTISWSHNESVIAISDRIQVDSVGMLTINELRVDDAGIYRCTASNAVGQVTAAAHLTVHAPPDFVQVPRDQRVPSGSRVEFRCRARGFPRPSITWFKNGRVFTNTERVLINHDGSILEIHNVGKADEATYLCRAENPAGTRDAGADLNIQDRAPPSFLHRPQNADAVLGSNVYLGCSAVADPPPRVSWLKNNEAITGNPRLQVAPDGTLEIRNVSERDEGSYTCIAENVLGAVTASLVLSVRAPAAINPVSPASIIPDAVIRESVSEASIGIDAALNDTLQALFNRSNRVHGPADLLRLVRFPSRRLQPIIRSAEVYERAIQIIHRHVETGATYNITSFSVDNLLSQANLELLANLSGCLAHRRNPDCDNMCYHSKYRSYDGSCNNLQHPLWGASETAFRRVMKQAYENGFNLPIGWTPAIQYHGYSKPNARVVSTSIVSTQTITPDESMSHMLMQWGQFLDHDLDMAPPTVATESFIDGTECKTTCANSPPCYPITIPRGDVRTTLGLNPPARCIEFVRSSPVCGSGTTSVFFNSVMAREQLNILTSYIDASQVYGSTEPEAKHLRDLESERGRLRVGIITESGKHMLPFNTGWPIDCRRNPTESHVGCFQGGDIRVNEQLALTAMHTVWLREHNRIADELYRINPHWDREVLYQEARKIVGAEMQLITYEHWMPKILGPEGMDMLGEYEGYDPGLDATISNEFATAVLRFGHTLINPVLHRLNSSFQPIPQGHVSLRDAFFSPFRLIEEGGIDPLLRGLFAIPAKLRLSNQLLNSELTEQLFRQAHRVALDLAAINIQRGRDHGLPSYNRYRQLCNLTAADTFDDLKKEIQSQSLRDQLQALYGHPDNIDLWVGGISEELVENGRVGPTFRCLLIEQFRRLRNGDRFFYTNPGVFRPEQLTQLRQTSLSRVLCDNGDDIRDIVRDAFIVANQQPGGYVSCTTIPKMDLRVWAECCPDCINGAATESNVISRLPRNRRSYEGFSYPHDRPANLSYAPKPQRETDPDYDERIEGLEQALAKVQKIISKLNRKVKQLTLKCDSPKTETCTDTKGHQHSHNESWHPDPCTRCLCQSNQITCTVTECSPLTCSTPVYHTGRCCPVC